MKYYSEVLDYKFDTEEELVKAEEEYEALQKSRKEKANEEKALISKEKKASAAVIKEAEDNVFAAQEKFNEAKKEAQKIIEEARKKAEDIVRTSSKELSAAQEKRYKALKEFNNKFGPYTVSYTGEKAYNEFKKAIDYFNDILNWDSWWF